MSSAVKMGEFLGFVGSSSNIRLLIVTLTYKFIKIYVHKYTKVNLLNSSENKWLESILNRKKINQVDISKRTKNSGVPSLFSLFVIYINDLQLKLKSLIYVPGRRTRKE